jgi:acyl-CoA reductase-like NAD-dependent aldehyde dehydrogenase
MIPASLELGGKDPMIVLASADPVHAAESRAAGQRREYRPGVPVDRAGVRRGSIADAFTDALVAAAGSARVNFPTSLRATSALHLRAAGEIVAEQIATPGPRAHACSPAARSSAWAAGCTCARPSSRT